MRRATTALRQSAHARLIAGSLLAIVVLAVGVAELSVVASADIAAANTVHSLATGWLTSVLLGVTDLASTDVILVATATAVVILAAQGHWRGAVALSVSVLATQAAVTIAKGLISRPRPEAEGAAVDAAGFSFPSAHSASAVALYVMLALIAGHALRRRVGGVAWLAAVSLVLAIGLSRVYLGAHYPTDVFAGWLLGASVVIGSWALCARLPAPPRPAAL